MREPRRRVRLTADQQARADKIANSARQASTEFYCSWGRHRTFPEFRLNTQFEHGTMCLECQMAITENIRLVIPIPELTAGLREFERRRMVADRTKAEVKARVKGDVPTAGFVYYIRINGQIKIGYAADITARMRHYPPGSELLAAEPGTPKTERQRHQDFRRYLLQGRE